MQVGDVFIAASPDGFLVKIPSAVLWSEALIHSPSTLRMPSESFKSSLRASRKPFRRTRRSPWWSRLPLRRRSGSWLYSGA